MVGGYITQTYRVFYIMSTRQSIRFHRESHRDATLLKFLIWLQCLGLNEKPKGQIHRTITFAFCMLDAPKTLERALLNRQNKFSLSSLLNFKLTNVSYLTLSTLLRVSASLKKTAGQPRKVFPDQPSCSSVCSSPVQSKRQAHKESYQGIYKICNITLKSSVCHYCLTHYIYFQKRIQ